MILKRLKIELRDLVASNNPEEALKRLKLIFQPSADQGKTQNLDTCISLLSRLSGLEENERRGKIRFDDYTVTRNSINDSISGLIKKITEEEAAAYEMGNSVFEKLLVVTENEDRLDTLKELFQNRYYKKVAFEATKEKLPAKKLREFDLMIFDNFEPQTDGIPVSLRSYLNAKTAMPILYFGPYIRELQQEYADQVYFSNSKFSLHSRVQEMILYLKHENSRKASENEE